MSHFVILVVVGDDETDNGSCSQPKEKKSRRVSLDDSSPTAEDKVGVYLVQHVHDIML